MKKIILLLAVCLPLMAQAQKRAIENDMNVEPKLGRFND